MILTKGLHTVSHNDHLSDLHLGSPRFERYQDKRSGEHLVYEEEHWKLTTE